MIAASLPPVFFGADIQPGEIFEAFAITYWAKYNTVPISSRVLRSMTRAFGVSTATMYPRTLTTQGMVIVRVGTPGTYRLIVAIEGAQRVGDIFTGLDALTPVSVTGCTGKVAKFVLDNVTALRAAIVFLSNDDLDLKNARIPVTFVGHSLGGAMAEVWAMGLKAQQPARTVKYISFGSPRLGNGSWVANKNPAVKFRHVYNDRDLIHYLPSDNTFAPQTWIGLGPFTYTWYRREPTCVRVNRFGRVFPDLPQHIAGAHPEVAAIINGMASSPDPTSYWYSHQSVVYRNWLMNYAYNVGGELQYRFNYLEFEDENQWQVLWTPSVDVNDTWNAIGPVPADAPVTSSAVSDLIAAPPVATRPTGQADPAFVGDEGDVVLGGDWAEEPVVSTENRPQRRQRLTLP